ncbi:MAG TPA: ABC transporter [Thermoanaerobaculia bacterium]
MAISAFYRSQVSADLRNVRRDDLLVWVAGAPFFLALAFRFGLPPLSRLLDRELGFDLAPYHGLLMSFFVLMAPTMVGWVIGFLLLDERDEGTLTALLVTPLPLGGYLLYRTAAPLLLAFAVTVAGYPIAGLAPLPFADLVAVSLVAALNGPANSLFLAAFAENKISGLALAKILNTLAMIPIAAFFITSQWQVVAGVMPTYWPMKMTWLAAAGQDYAGYVIPGLAVYGIVMFLLLKRFIARMRR